MMIMTETVDHKRRSHDSFGLSNISSSPSHNDSSGEKRLKTGGGGAGAIISTKEKKDKIGERVAKLQQLVSPFGKSDTASVLSEASDYIKFLHDQLQVLSAPYLRTTVTGNMEEGDYYSLRSRGLCLVPVDSTLSIAQTNGADLWAPVNSNRNP